MLPLHVTGCGSAYRTLTLSHYDAARRTPPSANLTVDSTRGPSAPRFGRGGLEPITSWALGTPLPLRGPRTDRIRLSHRVSAFLTSRFSVLE